MLIAVALCGFFFSILSSTGLSQTRRRIKAPEALLRDLDDEDRQCVVNEGGLRKHVRVQPFHISPTSQGEILARGSSSCLCGAQNCGFWIYRKTGGTYELLLKGIGATRVRLGHDYSQGYRDVVADSHASAIETIIRTYRFDGHQYGLLRCVSRHYFDENGNQTRKPEYSPCN